MLNFLKSFVQTDHNNNQYITEVRNTSVKFILRNATSMEDNTFRIDNKCIGCTLYGVEWETVEAIINITDPVIESL